MSKKDDGGPAFPTETENQVVPNVLYLKDMSLLDHFAGQALEGMLANPARAYDFDGAAEDAYRFAAAMLAERNHAERPSVRGTTLTDRLQRTRI